MSQAANSIIYRIMNTFSNACVQRGPKQAQHTNPLPISITVNLPLRSFHKSASRSGSSLLQTKS
nr:MAG TPA: hypothetical protein [Caudoviricetes sp.]